MARTQLDISDEDHKALKKVAKILGVPMVEIVRRGIRRQLKYEMKQLKQRRNLRKKLGDN